MDTYTNGKNILIHYISIALVPSNGLSCACGLFDQDHYLYAQMFTQAAKIGYDTKNTETSMCLIFCNSAWTQELRFSQ